MANQYNNKVVLSNGTTVIDLSTDTVTDASHIMTGHRGHLADGSVVDGTGASESQVVSIEDVPNTTGTTAKITGVAAPEGSISITTNGTHDVYAYEEAIVNVTPSLQSKSATPTETAQTITPDSNYVGLSSVSVGAISSTYVGSGITRRSSSDLTASGATVTAPAGYYASQATKSVATGTAGTPTATKGTIDNAAVTVTPSVTNTTGYITGGTKTGTGVVVTARELVAGSSMWADDSGDWDVANLETLYIEDGEVRTPVATKSAVSNHAVSVTPSVTTSYGWIQSGTKTGTAVSVSASELVSGTLSVTENGTADVTNYASINVNVSGGGDDGTLKGIIERTATTPTLPSDLTTIGPYAFAQYPSLALTSLPSTVTKIMSNAFLACTQLALTSLPAGVTEISGSAFQNCTRLALTSLPSGITKVNTYSFYQCTQLALTSLPAGVTDIGTYAFQGCTNLALSSLPSNLRTIGNSAFKSCPNITISEIPVGVTSIGQSVFQGCTGITTIEGQGVTNLGSTAFTSASADGSSNLETALFPNLTTMTTPFGHSTGGYACQKLETVDAGKVSTIPANAFANCHALQTLVLRKTGSICTLGNVSAFVYTPLRGYNSLSATVYVPSALIETYKTATNWSTIYGEGYVTFAAIEGSEWEL